MQDQGKRLAQAACVGDDHRQGAEEIEHRHEGDELFRHRADALEAAQQDQGRAARDHEAHGDGDGRLMIGRCREKGGGDGIDRACDGIDLGDITDAEGCHHAEQAEQDTQPLEAAAQAVFHIIHRSADPLALGVAPAVADAEEDLGVFRRHAQQGRDPHPEHGPGAA